MARRAGEGADVATVRQAVLGRDKTDSAVSSFHEAADGVLTLDTTDLTIEEAVTAVLDRAAEARA
ncbi:hypothetical protein GCM10025876_37220 [Demequina litorisediminis]|uniref:(d)CMP kinase n=1 Tax=Demequina litorisediminis TaxID=1849022 RepID=A0ABQ6ILE6_9MICO|nr:hypothetical protein GCM10025876_37220 [Demequina litorisediminis]